MSVLDSFRKTSEGEMFSCLWGSPFEYIELLWDTSVTSRHLINCHMHLIKCQASFKRCNDLNRFWRKFYVFILRWSCQYTLENKYCYSYHCNVGFQKKSISMVTVSDNCFLSCVVELLFNDIHNAYWDWH